MKTIRLTSKGDVLILETQKPSAIYVVGCVQRSGQQDFKGQDPLTLRSFTNDRDAIAHAQTMLLASGRIHLLIIDTSRWADLTERSAAQTSAADSPQRFSRRHP